MLSFKEERRGVNNFFVVAFVCSTAFRVFIGHLQVFCQIATIKEQHNLKKIGAFIQKDPAISVLQLF